MNELVLTDIIQQQPILVFNDYEKLLTEATMIAEKLNTMTVTEDNVKEQKKLLAKVNNSIKDLNDRRILIKKEILKPYTEFEQKVKEIESVVKTADTRLRSQVKELEEEERERKRAEVEVLFDNVWTGSKYAELITFDSFLKPEYLNKSFSMNKIEIAINDYFEKMEDDIDYLMENIEERYKANTIATYITSGELREALNDYKRNKELDEKLSNVKDDYKFEVVEDAAYRDGITEEIVTESAMFEVYGDDIDKVISFMNKNNIQYTRYKN